jgi:hypothetical protein
VTLTVGVTIARPSHAQDANDKAAAEALFDQGKALMAAGNYAAACPKFNESLRLDEGIGTSLWLAECFERSGKIASAWAQFREAAATAVKFGDPREKIAREHASSLEPKLSRLVIVVGKDNVPAHLKVVRDGEEVDAPLWGTPVPIDPGDHTVVASARGKKPFKTVAHVPPATLTVTVAIPVLEDDPEATESLPVVPVMPARPEVPSAEPPATRTEPDSKFRLVGISVGAVGVAGLVVGTVFGVEAMAKLNASNSSGGCDSNGGECKSQLGVDDRSAAQTDATVSTLGFVFGGAAVVGGALLYVFAPKVAWKTTSATVVPIVGPVGSGVALTGEW